MANPTALAALIQRIQRRNRPLMTAQQKTEWHNDAIDFWRSQKNVAPETRALIAKTHGVSEADIWPR